MIKRLGELGHGEGQGGDEAAHGLLLLTRRRRRRSDSECCSLVYARLILARFSELRTALSSLALPIYYFSGVTGAKALVHARENTAQSFALCLVASVSPLAPRNPRLAMTRTKTSRGTRASVDDSSKELL